MASPELQPRAPGETKPIPGWNGLERLDQIEALKKGSFREFLNTVVAIKQNPEEQKKISEELTRIDNDPKLSKEKKKELLRNTDPAKLLATIGKEISIEEKGIRIKVDFGSLAFAERVAVGAGHVLPPTISKLEFGNGKKTERKSGARGGEYRTEKNNYATIKTGTTLFIRYEDILQIDKKQEADLRDKEKEFGGKKATIQADTRRAMEGLQREQRRGAESGAATAPMATAETTPASDEINPRSPAETQEVQPSRNPIFIGDSQVEGLRGALASKGILAVDFRSRKMEQIAAALKDPSIIEHWYGRNEKYREGVKNRVRKFHDQITNADSIILQCGGNNIVAGDSLEKMQENFMKLVHTVRKFNPSAKIFAGLLIPPTDSSAHKETRAAFNEWLKTEAAKGSWKIIDSFGTLEDKNRPGYRDMSLAAPDMAHLNRKGYTHLAEAHLKTINYQAN